MDQKENISELLKRYILNECSDEEIKVVIAYFQKATNSSAIPSVEAVLDFIKEKGETERASSDLTSEYLLKTAKEKEREARPGRNLQAFWIKQASVAAVFIGMLIGGYIFWTDQAPDISIAIPKDAITLELGDGSIEILGEEGTNTVRDKKGNVIGQQKGGQISYGETGLTEELEYNTLTVPYGKRYDLKLSDGTVVHLNAGTSLKYPIKFLEGQSRKVYLMGEAFFSVSKDPLHPFVVNADELNVRVLGTQFNVSSYPEDTKTDVVLVEGSVGMHRQAESFDKNGSTILEPGYKGTFQRNNGAIEKEPVITDIYTAWIGGELVFRKMTFENILKKLERHYNVSINNNNADLAKEVFNASYGKVSLYKVLEDLRLTHGVEYSIDKTNITIN